MNQADATQDEQQTLGDQAGGLARAVPVALLLGALWASSGFTRSVTAIQYVILVSGCALSLLLGQWATSVVGARSRHWVQVLLLATLSTLLLLGIAHWLKVNTHHRPLAAATFAVFAAAALLGCLAVAVRFGSRLSAGLVPRGLIALCGLALAGGCLWQLMGAGQSTILAMLDMLIGLALVGFAMRLRRVPQLAKITPALVWSTALVLLVGCGFGLLSPAAQKAAQVAPVLAGLLGLLS